MTVGGISSNSDSEEALQKSSEGDRISFYGSLVQPAAETPGEAGGSICLVSVYENCNSAVRLLSAVLRRHGHRVTEIYFKHWVNNHFDPPTGREIELLAGAVRDASPDVVAFSVRCSAYEGIAGRLTAELRKTSEAFYLWGGIHPTLSPGRCLRHADGLIMGEGEIPLAMFMERIAAGGSFEDVPNLWTTAGFGGIRNPVAAMVENLDDLPFRDYTGSSKYYIDRNRITGGDPVGKSVFFTIMATRGCPFGCAYCYNSALRRSAPEKKKYFRRRSVDNLLEELVTAKRNNPNIRSIRFDDNIFPFQEEWVDEFCGKYPSKVGLPFECLFQPNVVNRGLFGKLAQAGLRAVTTGIQSTESVNKRLYKRTVGENRILDFARFAREAGLESHFQIMVDNPLSEPDEMRDQYETLRRIPRPYDIYLFSLTHYPGTEMTNKLLSEGVIRPEDVEGPGAKTFRQYRVSLDWPRSPEERFWLALFILVNKRFIPLRFLDRVKNSARLKKRPWPVLMAAHLSNLAKMLFLACRLIIRREMTRELLRQWLSIRSFITS